MSRSSRRLVVLSSVLGLVIAGLCAIGDGSVVPHVDAEDHIAAGGSGSSTHPPTVRSTAAPALPATPEEGSAPRAGALRLEGQVVDKRKRPVGGAKVSIAPDRSALTELDGSFSFDDLAEGDYSVIAEWQGAYAEERDVTLSDSSDPLMLELATGPSIHVRVISDEGTPIANAMVRTSGRKTRSDADGNAVLRAIDYDYEYVSVIAPGFATSHTRVTTGDDPSVTVEHAVVLASGAVVAGIVLDEDGKPVPEAVVALEQLEGQGERSERAYTDDKGAFTLEAIGRGNYTLTARSNDFITGPVTAVEVEGTTPVKTVVRVAKGAEVTGIVVDEHGRPIAEAEVHVGNRWVESAADGTFAARGLEPGKLEIGVRSKTHGASTQVREIAAREQVTLKLVLTPSSIAGIVVDASGQPVPDVSVAATSDDPQGYGYASTDEYGRFDLKGLPPGSYELKATRDDSRHKGAVVRATTGDRRVKITVADRASLTGTLMLDGKPVAYYGYELLEPSDQQTWSPTLVREASGTFLDEDVEPGLWTVAIVGPGFLPKLITGVRIAPGRVTDLGTLHAERGKALTGRVVDASGAPVADAEVRVQASFAGDTESPLRRIARGGLATRTASDGTYRLVGLSGFDSGATIEASHPTRGTGKSELDGREVVDLSIGVQ